MKIVNKSVKEYVMGKLSLVDDIFLLKDLDKVDELVINNETVAIDNEEFSFYELYKFNFIKKLNFRFFDVNEDEMLVLKFFKSLTDITFDNCNLSYLFLLDKLTSLSLINCNFNQKELIFLKNLESLTINNSNINSKKLNKLKELKYLNLSGCFISSRIKLQKLEELHIDNTNIIDFSFIEQLNNLNKLTIDEKQYNDNKEFFDSLNLELNVVIRSI